MPIKKHKALPNLDYDPVTYEVLSTKLWNINEEHAETIKRASGSQVVAFHDDFNTCIMTEKGCVSPGLLAGSELTSSGGDRTDQSRPGPKRMPLIEPELRVPPSSRTDSPGK